MVLCAETGFCGTDSEEYYLVPEDVYNDWINGTSHAMDIYADEFAYNNAAMYGIYPPDDEGYDDEDLETAESDDICAHWHEYDPDADADEKYITWKTWE